MSVIAAKVYDNAILIASDSILIKDDLKRTNFNKLRMINNVIVGGIGCADELCLFFDFVEQIEPKDATVHSIIQYIKDFSEYKESICGCKTIENAYLIIYKKKLFEVEGFFVKEVTDYTAIGAGETYALTAMLLGQTPEEAVKTTCELCCHVSLPVWTLGVSKGEY